MEILGQVLLLVLGFAFLVKGADWFVDGSASIASKFGIPQLVIGLTVVAMGTSAPEAAVSISAALGGNADITIGNIVGSNILNLLIILGTSSVITALAVAKATIKVDIPVVLAATVILLVMGLDGTISRIDAAIMLVLFIAYLSYLFYTAKNSNETEEITQYPVWKSLIMAVVGLALIIAGSQFTVNSASFLAAKMGVSQHFIGLTVVALGTSLPELFTSVSAARKGNTDIAIGNIVGSNIFNTLFIVGISGVIIDVPFQSKFIVDTIVSFAAAILLLLCCIRTRKLQRHSGIIMLLSYAVYFAYIATL